MNGLPEPKIPQSAQDAIAHTGTGLEPINRAKLKLAPLYVTLYGLFDASGHCWYVGQTIHDQTRINRHRVSGLTFDFNKRGWLNFYGSKHGPQKIFQPKDDFSIDIL